MKTSIVLKGPKVTINKMFQKFKNQISGLFCLYALIVIILIRNFTLCDDL